MSVINALKLAINTLYPAYFTRFVSVPKVALRGDGSKEEIFA